MVSNRLIVGVRQFVLVVTSFSFAGLFVFYQQRGVYEQVNQARGRFQNLREEHANLTQTKQKIQTDVNRTQHLIQEHATQLELLEQFTRKNNLILRGIRESDGEDTETLVLELFAEKFQLGIDPEHIEFAERISPGHGEKERPIKIRFLRWKDRSKVYYKRKNLPKEVSLEEDLTLSQKKYKENL